MFSASVLEPGRKSYREYSTAPRILRQHRPFGTYFPQPHSPVTTATGSLPKFNRAIGWPRPVVWPDLVATPPEPYPLNRRVQACSKLAESKVDYGPRQPCNYRPATLS